MYNLELTAPAYQIHTFTFKKYLGDVENMKDNLIFSLKFALKMVGENDNLL